MELKLSQALAVLQYLDEHPSEFNDEDRARIKRIIADVPFANLMHEARMEAREREKGSCAPLKRWSAPRGGLR